MNGTPAPRIRPVRAGDAAWIREAIAAEWVTPVIVARGRRYEADALEGLVAERDGRVVGLLTFAVEGAALHVVTIQALVQRAGVGTALVRAAMEVGRARGCARVRLVTTNDNERAMRFFRALGMRQVAVHAGAVVAARSLKPEIPRTAPDGTPITDEHEFEMEM